MRRYFAEAVGTFALVFAGTGAAVVNETVPGSVTHVGVALVFGLVVTAMIYAIGDVSGCHINPAVTLGFWIARRFPARDVAPYVAAQLLGAFAASGTLRLLFPTSATLGATLPLGSWEQSFMMEVILTGLLMFVILSVSTGAKERGILAGVAIGAVVALEALSCGPICGASMNPARSIAPAVVSGQTQFLWAYIAAPLLGAALAVPICRATRPPGSFAPAPAPVSAIQPERGASAP